MTTSQEQERFVRNPKLWCVSAIKWVFENPDFRYELVSGIEIKDPAWEGTRPRGSRMSKRPISKRRSPPGMLDKYAREAGDLGLEIWLMPPRHPYPEQEQLGVRHYKLSAEARKQTRALGIRAGDLEPWAVGVPGGDRARISRMVRHAAPFEHPGGGRHGDVDRSRGPATASWQAPHSQGQVAGRAGGHLRSAGPAPILVSRSSATDLASVRQDPYLAD